MNKLYVIYFVLVHDGKDFPMSTWYGWKKKDMNDMMLWHSEWQYTLKENNGTHCIYEAR